MKKKQLPEGYSVNLSLEPLQPKAETSSYLALDAALTNNTLLDPSTKPYNGYTSNPLLGKLVNNGDPRPSSEAKKFDEGKTDWSLMPFEVIEQITKVLEFGAKKYNEKGALGRDSWNWAKVPGLGKWRVLSAVFRHLFAYSKGEALDPESGLSHLSHAACGLVFLIYYSMYPDKYHE